MSPPPLMGMLSLEARYKSSSSAQSRQAAEGEGCRLQALSQELLQAQTTEPRRAEPQMDSRLLVESREGSHQQLHWPRTPETRGNHGPPLKKTG